MKGYQQSTYTVKITNQRNTKPGKCWWAKKKIEMSIFGNASFAKHWTQNNWSDFSAFLASQQSWHWPSFCALVWSGSVCTHSKTKQMQPETWIKTHRWRWNLSTERFNLFFVVMDFKQHNQMFMLLWSNVHDRLASSNMRLGSQSEYHNVSFSTSEYLSFRSLRTSHMSSHPLQFVIGHFVLIDMIKMCLNGPRKRNTWWNCYVFITVQ